MSCREKIGLIEAINLNVVDLHTSTYSSLLYTPTSKETLQFSLSEAVHKYRVVDAELLDLLHTPIGLRRNRAEITVLDSLKDSTLILEKYLYKNPFNNEYVQLDSHACKALLSEEIIKKIKRLVTRINVKSYVISLNPIASANGNRQLFTSAAKNLSNSHVSSSTQLINVKSPTVVYNKIQAQQTKFENVSSH